MNDPHWPEVVESIVTSIALVIGGGWAIWKWGFQERLRDSREVPALDGQFSARQVVLESGRSVVSLESLWRNKSPDSVPLDTQLSVVRVFRIGPAISGTWLSPESPGTTLEFVSEANPLAHCDHFWLEPHTESIITHHVVLEPDHSYFAQLELRLKSDPTKFWLREVVFQLNAT